MILREGDHFVPTRKSHHVEVIAIGVKLVSQESELLI